MPPRKSNLEPPPTRHTILARPGATHWDTRSGGPGPDPRALEPEPPAEPASAPEALIIPPELAALPPGRRRSIAAQLVANIGDYASLEAQEEEHNVVHLPFISAATRKNHEAMKRVWIEYFTVTLKSKQAALDTLKPGASLPAIKTMKQFILNTARWGISYMGKQGWSYITTRKNIFTIFGMASFLFILSTAHILTFSG